MMKSLACWPILLRGPPRLGLPISGYAALELLKGDSKMNMKQLCAATDRISWWGEINFRMAEKQVKKLQRRIAAAYRNNEMGKVASLQERLIHSFSAKALAVKIVSSNHGKNTAGVDGIVWKTDSQKLRAVYSLRRRGYRPRPLRRIYIRKPGGGARPLSIPTMKDRAMLTLYKFALEPIAELSGDPGSYGFRHDRSAEKAALRLMDECAHDDEFVWVLKADIHSCFDSIAHKWLLSHIPMDKQMLSRFLSCGYIDKNRKYPLRRGIPQGGSLSSLLCNMTLDGLEDYLHEVCGENILMVRYADDIIVVSHTQQLLVQSVLPAMNRFLRKRGLRLSRKKTQVRRIEDGLVFLGYQIEKTGQMFYALPSERSISTLRQKVEVLSSCLRIKPIDTLPVPVLLYIRNCYKWIIRGWLNYFWKVVLLDSFEPIRQEIAVAAVRAADDVRIADMITKIFYEKYKEENYEIK